MSLTWTETQKTAFLSSRPIKEPSTHVQLYTRVPTSSGNHGKPGKSLKKSSMHGKVIEFGKSLNNHGIARKQATGAIQNASMVYKHAVDAAFYIYAQRGEDAAKRGGLGL